MFKIEKIQPLTIFIIYIIWASFWLTLLGSIASNGGKLMTLQILLSEFYANISSEMVSIAVTVAIVDGLNRQRSNEEHKLILFRQAKSRSNDFAVESLDQIQHEGLWDELLKYHVSQIDKFRFNLAGVQWAGGVNLNQANLEYGFFAGANLQEAHLFEANLEGAYLDYSNLEGIYLVNANLKEASFMNVNMKGANLIRASLQQTILVGANLEQANLSEANLERAHLSKANLKQVYLRGANLRNSHLVGANLSNVIWDENTILPDGSKWTTETDLIRFTNPKHPNFWRSSDSEE